MDSILSVISNPKAAALSEPLLAQADRALQEAGAKTGPARWLATRIAAEIPFSNLPLASARDAVASALAPTPLDINALPAAKRRKKLLVADMDSTIITCECLDEIADLLGLKDQVSAITERAMRGELAFEPALRERVALLAGLDETRLEDVYRTRVHLTAGARKLVATMHANSATAVLVSGGFTFFTAQVAADAGFDTHRGNRLLADHGKLTGKVGEPILGREAKLATLLESLRDLRLSADDALAVGDGANDLAMIQAAGLGVAFHAKPVVAAAASARIDHGDLTALLYLQGYAAKDFMS